MTRPDRRTRSAAVLELVAARREANRANNTGQTENSIVVVVMVLGVVDPSATSGEVTRPKKERSTLLLTVQSMESPIENGVPQHAVCQQSTHTCSRDWLPRHDLARTR